MKKKILGIILPFLVAILCGYIAGKFVYKTYLDDINGDLRSSRLYLVEGGKYNSYDEMRQDNNGSNYIYYKDNDGYKTVVGITKNYDNIEKIKKLYSYELDVDEYYVPLEYMKKEMDEYDDKLMGTNDIQEVKEVVDNILNLYRSDENIKLIAIE